MLNLLPVAVILPLVGAGGVLLASFLLKKLDVERERFWTPVVAAAIAILTLVLVLALKGGGGTTATLSFSHLALLGESMIRFHLHPGLWPLAVGVTLAACSFLLAELNPKSDPTPNLSAVLLVLLGISLAALWSANPLTTIISWALYDLLLFLGQITAGVSADEALGSLALGSVTILLMWAGVLVAGQGVGNVQWSLIPAGGTKMTLWMVAALVRLGAYPLHRSMGCGAGSPSAHAAMLSLSPVIGWGLCARLTAANAGLLPLSAWTTVPAVLTLLAGGFLAWTARSSADARRWIGMGAGGAILFSCALTALYGAPQGAAADVTLSLLTLGSASWVPGVTLLFLGGGWSFRGAFRRTALPFSIPSLVGALSLIGAPVTLGFVPQSVLAGQLARLGVWIWIAGFVAGQTFLVAALGRWLFSADRTAEMDLSTWPAWARAAGLMAPALMLVIGGLIPTLLFTGAGDLSLRDLVGGPGPVGWSLWVAPLLLGGVLAWQDSRLRPKISLWLGALHDLVRLDWAYDLLVGAFERGLGFVRVVDRILGGKGALLWSLVAVLIFVLAGRGS
ncbi:MAG: hypothetical protein ACOC7N_03130 [Chloroflexota bacterium]